LAIELCNQTDELHDGAFGDTQQEQDGRGDVPGIMRASGSNASVLQ
jgi:hypothetical protein